MLANRRMRLRAFRDVAMEAIGLKDKMVNHVVWSPEEIILTMSFLGNDFAGFYNAGSMTLKELYLYCCKLGLIEQAEKFE